MRRDITRGRLIMAAALALLAVCVGSSCLLSPVSNDISGLYPAVVRIVCGNKLGSGVMVQSSGCVLTSWHVVGEDKTAYVVSSKGVEYEGSVMAADRQKDLAIITVKGGTDDFSCANLGSSQESDGLQIGDAVTIAGYPAYSSSAGPILSEGVICAFPVIESVAFIQSSAQVYPGSSGGPMISRFGDVIGIVNGRYTNISEGCTTFATAADEAVELMNIVYGSDIAGVVNVHKAAGEQASVPRTCPNVGCKAPGFILSEPNGERSSIESFRGRKVLLVFAGSACTGCLQLMQCVSKISDNWPRAQLEVLVVVSKEDDAAVREWIEANEINCRVLLDTDGRVRDLYGPAALPALYFIDKYGRIKIKRVNIRDHCTVEIDSLLRLY